jgi:MFS family permease
LIALIFVQQTWQFYVVGLLFGYGWGGLNTQVLLIIADIFGLRGMGAIVGTASVGYNVGSAVGPAVGGMAFDTTGNYSVAFGLGALGMVIAIILVWITRPTLAKIQASSKSKAAAA